jgi:hypothetical protein
MIAGLGKTQDSSRLGSFRWPHDPFFRPTVGVFVDHNLAATVPTVRAPIALGWGKTEWGCAFDAGPTIAQLEASPERLALVCLETAEPLVGRGDAKAGSSSWFRKRLGVDDLLILARQRRRRWDASGFTQFLQLSFVDQLQLLYVDFLGRDAESDGFVARLEEVLGGKRDILDYRDQILASEEFRGIHRGLDERLGDWMVWGGLELASPFLVPAAAPDRSLASNSLRCARARSPFVSYIELISQREDLGEHLATMALGRQASRKMRDHWLRQHAAQIAAVVAEAARTRAGRDARPAISAAPYRFKGLLSSMTIGRRGRRVRGKGPVYSTRGRAGHVAHGPYLHLQAGDYKVTVAGRSASPTGGLFALEATYAGLFLARREFPRAFADGAPISLDFSLSPRAAALLCEGRFEFRLWTDGVDEIYVDAIELRQGAPAGSVPSRLEALSLVNVGGAGRRIAGGAIESAPEADGHVFYGPYLALRPGNYCLSVECAGDGSAPMDGEVTLEAISAQIPTIASQRFTLFGDSEFLVLPFSIPDAPLVGLLPDRVEFRLTKKPPTTFEVRSINCVRTGD